MSNGIQTNANPTALPGTTVHFLRALEMLFRAGRYYPADHDKTRELADAFRAAAHEVVLGSGRLVFEVRDGVLHLQGEAVPPDVPGAAGFLALLEPLAVARLTLDADIGRSDLHALVNLLPQLQQQVVEARIDERFVFQGLPDGVSIEQREFVVGEEDGEGEIWEILRGRILEALKELEGRGLDAERIALCRHLTRGFGARLAASLEAGEESQDRDAETAVVESLDLTAVVQEDAAAVARSLDELVDLLEQSMLGDDAARTEQTFRKLIGILERSVPATWRVDQAATRWTHERDTADHHMDLEALQELLAPVLEGQWGPPVIDPGERRELLSIVGSLLGRSTSTGVRRRLGKELESALASGPSSEAKALLYEAAAGLLDGFQSAERWAGMLDLVRAFRRASSRSSLELLVHLSHRCPPEARDRLWPLLLNEVLLGGGGEWPELMAEAEAWLSPLPSPGPRARALQSLLTLEAVGEELMETERVRSLPRSLVDVFAAVLRETGDNPLSRLIITSIHSRPASWLAASVLPLVDPHTGDHRELYALILEQSRQEGDIPQLRALASELLVTRLSSLPRERRSESWVRGSILVLGRLRGEASAALLARIRGERRWLILPAWPLECRKAAVAAQQVLQRGREETP